MAEETSLLAQRGSLWAANQRAYSQRDVGRIWDLYGFVPPNNTPARPSAKPRPRPQAEVRAKELLRSLLSPSQLAEFDAKARFGVRGSQRGTYIVDKRRDTIFALVTPKNNFRMNEDFYDVGNHTIVRLCMEIWDRAYIPVPASDRALARKVWLEANELEVLATANVFPEVPVGKDAFEARYPGIWDEIMELSKAAAPVQETEPEVTQDPPQPEPEGSSTRRYFWTRIRNW